MWHYILYRWFTTRLCKINNRLKIIVALHNFPALISVFSTVFPHSVVKNFILSHTIDTNIWALPTHCAKFSTFWAAQDFRYLAGHNKNTPPQKRGRKSLNYAVFITELFNSCGELRRLSVSEVLDKTVVACGNSGGGNLSNVSCKELSAGEGYLTLSTVENLTVVCCGQIAGFGEVAGEELVGCSWV